jgi:hypothetical protein
MRTPPACCCSNVVHQTAGAPTWNTGADTERSGTAWDNLLGDIKGPPASAPNNVLSACYTFAFASCTCRRKVPRLFAAHLQGWTSAARRWLSLAWGTACRTETTSVMQPVRGVLYEPAVHGRRQMQVHALVVHLILTASFVSDIPSLPYRGDLHGLQGHWSPDDWTLAHGRLPARRLQGWL